MSPERCLLGAKINPGLKRYAEFTGPADAFKRDQHAVLPVRQHDTFFDDLTFVFPRPHGETKLQPEFAQSRHWQVTSAGLFFGEPRVSLVRGYGRTHMVQHHRPAARRRQSGHEIAVEPTGNESSHGARRISAKTVCYEPFRRFL